MDDGKNPVEKLAYIVSERKLCSVYEEFLVDSIAWENFGFLLDVERYQELDTKDERKAMAKIIFDKFMEEDSLFTLGDILPEVKETIYNRLEDAPPKLFNSLLRRTTMSLAHSTISDFENSDLYQQYLAIEGQKDGVELHYDHFYKIILIGSNGVGKSSILGRYAKNKFDGEKKATQGPEFCVRTTVIAQKAVKAQIWDTSGQEKFFTITRGYYRNSLGVALVYDITSKESFQALDHWLNDVRTWAADAIIVLIGNKCDKSARQVTRDEGVNYAHENNIDLFFEASALEGTNIAEAFSSLLEAIYKKFKAIGGPEYQFEHSRITLLDDLPDEAGPGCQCSLL